MAKVNKSIVDKDKLWVQFEGRIYRLETKTRKHATGGEDTAKELIAPFNCKVVKIHVKPGQTLKPGDPVVSVEAMKMEYTYTSPKAGNVAKVLVEEGKIIQEGTHFIAWEGA